MHGRHNLHFKLQVHSRINLNDGRRLCTPGLQMPVPYRSLFHCSIAIHRSHTIDS